MKKNLAAKAESSNTMEGHNRDLTRPVGVNAKFVPVMKKGKLKERYKRLQKVGGGGGW